MTQLSFRASPVLIDAETTEISVCQKVRTDGQTDGQMAFQLYIVDITLSHLISEPCCRILTGLLHNITDKELDYHCFT